MNKRFANPNPAHFRWQVEGQCYLEKTRSGYTIITPNIRSITGQMLTVWNAAYQMVIRRAPETAGHEYWGVIGIPDIFHHIRHTRHDFRRR